MIQRFNESRSRPTATARSNQIVTMDQRASSVKIQPPFLNLYCSVFSPAVHRSIVSSKKRRLRATSR